jgi:hypothetical protein
VPEYFAKHKILGFETNQVRGKQATRRERRAVQPTISQDVALRSRISREEFVFELQLANQSPDGFWKSGALRTSFKQKPISSNCGD